jgi:hypothetical protein
MQSSIVSANGETFITVFAPGLDQPLVAGQSHPNFDAIMAAALAGEAEGIEDLFDVGKAVAARFERLTERIAVSGGHITLDGDVIDNSLTKQVLRLMDEGTDEDWKPLVAFFEKVQSNPDAVSREQLYVWVERQEISITDEGDLVCYKGVTSDGEGGYRSINSGKAIVDGEVVNGQIPNAVGSVIEMPRSEVHNDPQVHCSRGLHVGSYDYAQTWGRNGAMLEVHVNPRDFVSVPGDGAGEKARTCRYRVVQALQAPHASFVVPSYSEDDWDEEYNDGGYDSEGYDADGFDSEGYDRDGVDWFGGLRP